MKSVALVVAAVLGTTLCGGCDAVFGLHEADDAAGSGSGSGGGDTGLVHSGGGESSLESTNASVALPPPRAGDLIVVVVGAYMTGVASVTDSAHDTYNLAIGPLGTDGNPSSSATQLSIYVASDVATASSFEVTAAATMDGDLSALVVAVMEYDRSPATIDAMTSNVGTAGTPACGTLSAAHDDELAIAAIAVEGGDTIAAGAQFTLEQQPNTDYLVAPVIAVEARRADPGQVAGAFGSVPDVWSCGYLVFD